MHSRLDVPLNCLSSCRCLLSHGFPMILQLGFPGNFFLLDVGLVTKPLDVEPFALRFLRK